MPLPDDPYEMKTVEFKTVELKKEMFYLSKTIADEFLCDVDVDLFRDIMRQEMVATLKAHVFTDNLEDITLSVSTPATWWDHFKRDVIPDRLRKWFPVKNKTVEKTYQIKAIYKIKAKKYCNNLRIIEMPEVPRWTDE